LYSMGQKWVLSRFASPFLLITDECLMVFSGTTREFEPKTHDFFWDFCMMLLNCK
jgi:hypothetical protein